ncbi:MAG: class I SAM-dependent methyltransferase [Chloroflexota bacterium]
MNQRDTAHEDARRDEWTRRARMYADYALPKNRPFARRLVDLLDIRPRERVLDIAAGPGPVAALAGLAAGPAGSVLATDLSPVWESFVAAEARSVGAANVDFAAMPGEALALTDASFDVVACQFGLMFMKDAGAALAEMRRVLRPGGRLGVAVWSTPEKVGHFKPMRVLQESLPADPAGAGGPNPLSLGAPGLIESLVAGAGFEDVALHPFTANHVVEDPELEWTRLSGEGAFADRLAELDEAGRARSRAAVMGALDAMRQGDAIVVSSEALIVTARTPG